jgi:hypothetical protein
VSVKIVTIQVIVGRITSSLTQPSRTNAGWFALAQPLLNRTLMMNAAVIIGNLELAALTQGKLCRMLRGARG